MVVEIHSHDGAGGALALEGTSGCLHSVGGGGCSASRGWGGPSDAYRARVRGFEDCSGGWVDEDACEGDVSIATMA